LLDPHLVDLKLFTCLKRHVHLKIDDLITRIDRTNTKEVIDFILNRFHDKKHGIYIWYSDPCALLTVDQIFDYELMILVMRFNAN
jgi:hypothetical protein